MPEQAPEYRANTHVTFVRLERFQQTKPLSAPIALAESIQQAVPVCVRPALRLLLPIKWPAPASMTVLLALYVEMTHFTRICVPEKRTPFA